MSASGPAESIAAITACAVSDELPEGLSLDECAHAYADEHLVATIAHIPAASRLATIKRRLEVLEKTKGKKTTVAALPAGSPDDVGNLTGSLSQLSLATVTRSVGAEAKNQVQVWQKAINRLRGATDGLGANDPLCVPRKALLDRIMCEADEKHHVMVASPPATGKSALLDMLLRRLMQQKGIRVFHIAEAGFGSENSKMTFDQWAQNRFAGMGFHHGAPVPAAASNTDSRADKPPVDTAVERMLTQYDYIVFDDAQVLPPGAITALVKASRALGGTKKARLIFFASISPESVETVSPVVDSKIGWADLKLTATEQKGLADRMIQWAEELTNSQQLQWYRDAMALLCAEARGHIGVLRILGLTLLHQFVGLTAGSPQPSDDEAQHQVRRYYFGAMFDSAFARRFGLFDIKLNTRPEEQHMLQSLLQGSKVPTPPARDETSPADTAQQLVARRLMRSIILAPSAEDPTVLDFVTPLHRRFYFRAAYPSNIDTMTFVKKYGVRTQCADGTPSTKISFDLWLLATLRSLSQWQRIIADPNGHGKNNALPLEATFQHMFWCAASALLPMEGYRLAAEVSRIVSAAATGSDANSEERESSGRVDFWVNSSLNWAIELMCGGNIGSELHDPTESSIRGHLKRFAPGGKYHNLRPDQWRVVCFQTHDGDLAKMQQLCKENPNLLIVRFDEKFESLTFINRDGTCLEPFAQV